MIRNNSQILMAAPTADQIFRLLAYNPNQLLQQGGIKTFLHPHKKGRIYGQQESTVTERL